VAGRTNESELQRLVQAMPAPILALSPDREFTVLAASEQCLRTTHTDASILGRPLFEIFPDNPGLFGAEAKRLMDASLRRVLDTRAPDSLPLVRYDLPPAPGTDDPWQERYWSALTTPVFGADGEIEYLLHRAEDAGSDAPERVRLSAESERLRRMYETALDSTPDFFYVFDLEHRAIYANEALRRVWGVDDVRGKKWMDLGYEQWHADLHDGEIDRVIATRAPIHNEIPFTGTNGTRVYDYIFAPVFGAAGEVVAIAGVTRDVTERQAAEQALREQAARLAESDRAKDEFLATLSHELRNPLAPLRNAIALLRSAGGDERVQQLQAVMDRQVRHLMRLVDDLLELSRISRGTLALRKEPVTLATVMRNAVETSAPLIEAGGHELVQEFPPEPLWMEGDAVRLAQILGNLLNNAAKYTPDGGRIELRAWREHGQAVVSVRDNGLGIAPEMLPRLFDMFSRGDRETARSQGGLGIGLALARRLVDLHEGTLVAHSDGNGHGSEFVLRLPLRQAEPSARDLAANAAAAAENLSGLRVLVVDDNHDGGDSIAALLGQLGAQVRVLRDGASALAAIGEFAPAVAIVNIGMPVMNGYEVARRIRARPDGRDLRLIALTGWGQEDDRRRGREAGFDHHLVKPANLGLLLGWLAQSRWERRRDPA
jgi:PAS domain S-box-containing protein